MYILGIIIGTNTSYISYDYYKKNEKKLEILYDYELLNKGDPIPYDYAIFCEIKSLENKNNCKVIPLLGYDLTLQKANQCDYIFCIYESVFSFMDNNYEGSSNPCTLARFWQSVVSLRHSFLKPYPNVSCFFSPEHLAPLKML